MRSRPVALQAFGALLLFGMLAVIHTWPLATAPASLGRTDNKDTVLNTWALAWVAHALTTAPSRVLDGNIFHPERHTLAFSEPVIVPGALSVPVRAAGADPVLTYNISLLIGYALSAWAMQWLAWRWTGHYGASLVAGSLFTFNAHALVSMGHIQAIHAYGLPLLLVGLDGLIDPAGRRLWHGLLAGAATGLLALTSGYLTIFGIVTALIVIAVRARDLLTAPYRPLLVAGLAGAVVAGALVAPVLRAFVAVRQTHGFERSLDLVAQMSANASAYAATPARVHQAWAADVYARQAPRDSLFPGLIATALAVAGVVVWRPRRTAHVWIGIAIALTGLLLSFGPATPLYRPFYALVPFASGVRAASRFGVLWLTGIAVLAAFGTAALAARRTQRVALLVSALALVGVNVEAFRGPVPFVPVTPVSPLYDRLAALPDGVVAEMPFWWDPIDVPRNADYMLGATHHWKPLLNGYSGFTPASYRRHADALWYFPFRAASFDMLRETGVRYVVLHLADYGSQRRDAMTIISDSGRLRMLERTNDAVLYEVVH
ncbi:MAG TPA: hypothetical protein VMF13_14910 [Luteitalea sp.]|nr:hypothetical protein [Luteitalea sp.]